MMYRTTTAQHLLDTTCALALLEPLATGDGDELELVASTLLAHQAANENDISRLVRLDNHTLNHELFQHHLDILRTMARHADTSDVDRLGWDWSKPLQEAGRAVREIQSIHEDIDLDDCDTVALAAIIRHLVAVIDDVVPSHMTPEEMFDAEAPLIAEIVHRATGAHRDVSQYAHHGRNALDYSRTMCRVVETSESRCWTLASDATVLENFVPKLCDLDVVMRLLPVEAR